MDELVAKAGERCWKGRVRLNYNSTRVCNVGIWRETVWFIRDKRIFLQYKGNGNKDNVSVVI